jgi:hypothetical protein
MSDNVITPSRLHSMHAKPAPIFHGLHGEQLAHVLILALVQAQADGEIGQAPPYK